MRPSCFQWHNAWIDDKFLVNLERIMASHQHNVDFVVGQIDSIGDVSYKKMFGEYGIYVNGKMVAMLCDDLLFVKPTKSGREYLQEVVGGTALPGCEALLPNFRRPVGGSRMVKPADGSQCPRTPAP